ncbi:MEDS domain-containing protein [Streptomyces sp. TG1A-8]|uniref:MEDS domain-containing protein n=1 Tax=Streptomyces sp. TG1A-8 TaxID=3051385 RepID=UPI00265B9C84|nr:MEDS domain-containing protein [Streptomyces sp. TG1A-8]MDO0924728.1 MEDS domain-containing protein [Streptomyces sp. TG1A-8]
MGRHVGVVYSTDAEWSGRLVSFVRTGLDRGEQVRYFADATDPGRVMRTLTDHGVDAARAARCGRLVVTTAAQTYLAGAVFDPDAMIALWHEAVAAAAEQGHRGLRAIGEMSWGGRDLAGAERLLEYELRIHREVFVRLPLTAWCFYDRRLLAGDALEVLAGAHPTRRGPAGGAPGLSVTPLADRPGFRLSGSAGYENRHVTAALAAALDAAPAEHVTLDLSGLRHIDVAALAGLARAAARRPAGLPVRLLGAPPTARRMLELFPELGRILKVDQA